ncbi:MAG: hypothetical protein J1E35_00240 [Lachnospiraceae bacterium]|nr:hypothetical protein [Lachnospiraceae bacterium]
MNYPVFFLLQLKRPLKSKAFVLLLFLFPVFLFALSQAFSGETDSRIPVGVCSETDDLLTENLCRKLTEGNDSLFRFFEVSSQEELTRLVQNGQIECGYLFQKPLEKELDRSHTKNLITVLVSENTTCKGILNEFVYANLFEEYSLHLLKETLADAGDLPFDRNAAAAFSLPPVTEEYIEQNYRAHLLDGDTFTFEVTFLSANGSDETAGGTAPAAFSLFRGFASVFLLLCGFLALLTLHEDLQNGLYKKLRGIKRPVCMSLTMLSYLLPAGFVFLLSLGVSGCMGGILRELISLFCYLLVLLVFYALLGTIIRSHTMLCAAFPMLLLCTLVFTPVIVDLSAFFPWIKAVRYALPTYYYLLFF